ncbi:MAG: response regulator [bacterium]|nr:response regulator [bacterium]
MAQGTKKILIVDDDDFLVDVYASRFREAGFDVDVALSGDVAIEKLKAGFNPDVVTLDVMMPRANGFDVLSTIQKEQLMKKGIVVMISNIAGKHDIQKGLRMGARAYFVKINHTPAQIVGRVEKLLEHKT